MSVNNLKRDCSSFVQEQSAANISDTVTAVISSTSTPDSVVPPKKSKMTEVNSSKIKLPAGLELLYDLERQNVHNTLDAFALALHWSVVRAGLRFKSENPNHPEDFTERLPVNWSATTPQDGPSRHLAFDYFFPDDSNLRYQVRIVELTPNNQVVVTIYRSNVNGENQSTPATSTNGADHPPTNHGTASNPRDRAASTFFMGDFIQTSLFTTQSAELNRALSVFYNCVDLERQIWSELMEPLNLRVLGQPPIPGPYDSHTQSSNSAAENSTQSGRRQRNPRDTRSSLIEDRRRPIPMGPMGGMGGLGPLGVGGRIGPPSLGGPLGRSDLDPLGGVGAGMLADPRGFRNPRGGPGGLVPGQLPPGARFDPFGPPNPGRPGAGTGQWAVPNPDHEQPPPGFDDMFM